MEPQVLRQNTSVLSETNRTSVEGWKMNRKRLRVDEESFTSIQGRRDSDLLVSKSRKHNQLFLQDRFPQTTNNAVKPVSDKRALLPLSDTTHETREQKLCDSDLKHREINLFSTSSPPNPHKTTPAIERPEGVTVTYVNNLFSPVNKLQAIPLTLDELRRRTEYPEFFGRSELVSYLRHSKTTGNDIMAKHQLQPNSGRTRLNVLSRLCEREATTLANGIHTMNNEYFPMDYVVDTMKEQLDNEKIGSECNAKNETIDETKETISNTMELLENLKKILKNPEEDLAEDLNIFEKATHTFGCQNILNHISFVQSYLEQLQKKV